MKDKSNGELVIRLSEIDREIDKLQIEYNQIIKEIWERIPSLKGDENLQPKIRRRVKDENI